MMGNFDYLNNELDTDSETEVLAIRAGNYFTLRLVPGIIPYSTHIRTNIIPLSCSGRDENKKELYFHPIFKADAKRKLDIKVGDIIKFKIVKQPKRW